MSQKVAFSLSSLGPLTARTPNQNPNLKKKTQQNCTLDT